MATDLPPKKESLLGPLNEGERARETCEHSPSHSPSHLLERREVGERLLNLAPFRWAALMAHRFDPVADV